MNKTLVCHAGILVGILVASAIPLLLLGNPSVHQAIAAPSEYVIPCFLLFQLLFLGGISIKLSVGYLQQPKGRRDEAGKVMLGITCFTPPYILLKIFWIAYFLWRGEMS